MKKVVLLLLICALIVEVQAQEKGVVVGGLLVDATDKSPLIGATVQLINIKDSTKSKYTVTNYQGAFLIENVQRAFYRVNVRSLGYKPYTKIVRIGDVDLNLGKISVQQDAEMLKTIEVEAEVIPVEQKGDTTIYGADAFKVNPDASTADLISKMPGIVVDASGVTANGESVEQVLLDGKRFFGQDPLLSLNTIPAEVVNKIEVFDQRSEQAQLTGFDDGNTTKTMNVVTKEEKRNGKFGKFYGGYGTDALYKSGMNVNSFNKDKRLTILGMANNINQQNFSDEDLAGISSNQRGFRRRGNQTLMTGTQSGITETQSIGTNFTDDWGEKATFEGNYFFNKTKNSNREEINRETFDGDETQQYSELSNTDTDNLNHRLNMRINYKIDKQNSLRFYPSFSFQDNTSIQNSLGSTESSDGATVRPFQNNYTTTNTAYNFTNRLIYQHKFEKIGRTISVDFDTRYNVIDRSNINSDAIRNTLLEYLTDESSLTLGGEISYTEPVGNSAQLELSYELSNTDRDSDKETYQGSLTSEDRVFADSLSNSFVSGYTKHITSLNLTNRAFGKFFRFGIRYQHARLNNEQFYPEVGSFQNTFNNILPTAMGRLEFSGGGSMFIRYNASTTEPSVDQLQNVVDNSDRLFISLGNPELSQSYTHSLFWRASKSNPDKNTSLSNFTRIQMTQNYIANKTVIAQEDIDFGEGFFIQEGAQISQPINMNGYWNVTSNLTYSFLFSPIKSNINTSVGLGYLRQPGITDDQTNISNTYTGSGRMAIASNFSENVDFNVFYSISTNSVNNSIQSDQVANSNYTTHTVGGKFNLIFWKGFVFRNDINYQMYNAVNDDFDTEFALWNMSIAKKFLKNDMAELELSVFDLLEQNNSVSQSVNPTYIEETRTEVLSRYFMLTFTYQLRKFK